MRPRRLEPDVISYLQEAKSSLLQSLTSDPNDETTNILLWNVLEEIAPRTGKSLCISETVFYTLINLSTASAASDRHACELIEILVNHMSHRQLCFLIHKMEGYFSHLWTNRYSSHVLQRLLSKVGQIIQAEEEVNDKHYVLVQDITRTGLYSAVR